MIDEIGLISLKTFEAIELICRNVKGNNLLFGGIQIIGVGSFKQLPPVPSISDRGLSCFQSPLFKHVFPHHMHLCEVVRQHQIDLINAINEICDGFPSPETFKLMDELSRTLPHNILDRCTFIFGTNFDVMMYNYEQMHKLPGQMVSFETNDNCSQKYLKTCNALRIVTLKVNCKVLVIRNLDNGLVNGLTGKVVKINEDSVEIVMDHDKNLMHNFAGKKFRIEKICLSYL